MSQVLNAKFDAHTHYTAVYGPCNCVRGRPCGRVPALHTAVYTAVYTAHTCTFSMIPIPHPNFHCSLYTLSPVRLSSVVCMSVTLVHPTQAVQIFGNISTAFGPLAIDPLTSTENFMEIVPGEPLRQSAWGVKPKRGSQV